MTVLALRHDYYHQMPQGQGAPWSFPAGDVVALRYGTTDVVVSSERCQCFSSSIFTDLGIDLARKHIVLVKSYQHFLAGFRAVAGDVIYMSAPGAVPPDPRSICYQHFDCTRLYPWAEDPLNHPWNDANR